MTRDAVAVQMIEYRSCGSCCTAFHFGDEAVRVVEELCRHLVVVSMGPPVHYVQREL